MTSGAQANRSAHHDAGLKLAPMDDAGFSVGGRNATDPSPPHGVRLPLVTFILTRRDQDQGPFIEAIRAQTYPRFEAIIIDPLPQPAVADPRFRMIPCDAHASAFERAAIGLAAAEGEFVAFFDASDLPLPEFASTHIQVHLGSRHSIAFTASRSEATGGPEGESGNGQANLTDHPMLPAEPFLRLACLGDEDFARLSANTTLVEPAKLGWTALSDAGRMYRRFVVNLLHPVAGKIVTLPTSPAEHYAPLCQLLGGSAAIDMPLSRNLSAAQIRTATNNADPSPRLVGDPHKLAVWAENGSDFSRRIGPARYWGALSLMLGASAERLTPPETAGLLDGPLPLLTRAFGAKEAIDQLDRMLPRQAVLVALRNHHGNRLPLRVHWALQSIAFRRLHEGIRLYMRARRHRRRRQA